VRELAGQLAINPNTIGKAYKQLEQEGIITTRPGAGAFIANFDSQLSKTVGRERGHLSQILTASLARR
jgi:GntR family transcriptional regulator